MIQTLTYNLLSLSNKKEWSYYLGRFPEHMQDIYFGPEYYEIYEKNGDGKAYCFIFEDEDNFAMYPNINNLNFC